MTAPSVPKQETLHEGPGGGYSLREWYSADAVFELERERLFRHSWSLVGTTEDLAGPGEYLTPVVAGAPLLVIRGEDGELRAFHNICRHRGVVLVEGQGRLDTSVTCPYHAWSYGLDGALLRVPQSRSQFPDVDPGCWGLLPASVDEWRGMVFASPDPELARVTACLGELGDRLESHLAGDLTEVASASYVLDCNWKFVVENHIDVYHLWYLHRESLGAFDHPGFVFHQLGRNWWSEEFLRDPTEAPEGLPWLTDVSRSALGAHLLFPNLMLVSAGNYFATYDATPIDASHTSLTLRIRARPGADGADLLGQVRSFLAEDVEVCARLQRAVDSPAFALGPLARTHEAPIRAFHANLRAALGLTGPDGDA